MEFFKLNDDAIPNVRAPPIRDVRPAVNNAVGGGEMFEVTLFDAFGDALKLLVKGDVGLGLSQFCENVPHAYLEQRHAIFQKRERIRMT